MGFHWDFSQNLRIRMDLGTMTWGFHSTSRAKHRVLPWKDGTYPGEKKKLAAMKIPDTHLSAGTTSEDIVQNIINKVLTLLYPQKKNICWLYPHDIPRKYPLFPLISLLVDGQISMSSHIHSYPLHPTKIILISLYNHNNKSINSRDGDLKSSAASAKCWDSQRAWSRAQQLARAQSPEFGRRTQEHIHVYKNI